MGFEVGSIFEGKVTGITKFGAFVSLPENRSGMVHISEVAEKYVSDIREHLQEGQEVTVKVISVDKEGRLNLSIKKAREREPVMAGRPAEVYQKQKFSDTFEDKLKLFMQDSESKISDLRHQSERKGGSYRRGRR